MVAKPSPDFEAVLTSRGIRPEALCAALKLGMPTWRSWVRGDRKPGLDTCHEAERLLGIPKHELRPDVWPPPGGCEGNKRTKNGGNDNGTSGRVTGRSNQPQRAARRVPAALSGDP